MSLLRCSGAAFCFLFIGARERLNVWVRVTSPDAAAVIAVSIKDENDFAKYGGKLAVRIAIGQTPPVSVMPGAQTDKKP